MSEEELKKTLEGFEVPPPKKSSPQPEEDRGFEVSDDEVLGPPPQMEVMKSSPPKWGGGGGGRPFKKPTQPPSSVSTSGTKPRKWGQVSLSHTQASIPPPPVNQERKVDVQKIGKLVIPSVFESTATTSLPSSPKRKPVNPVSKPAPQQVKPVLQPVKPTSKQETTPSPAAGEPAVTQKLAEPVRQVEEPDKLESPLAPPTASVKQLCARFEKAT